MKWFYVAAVLVFLALVCFNATGASAATFTTTCPDPGSYDVQSAGEAAALACAAEVERLEQLDADVLASAGTGSTSLSGTDQQRLDLTWVGIWLLLGWTVGQWFFRPLDREMRRFGGERG